MLLCITATFSGLSIACVCIWQVRTFTHHHVGIKACTTHIFSICACQNPKASATLTTLYLLMGLAFDFVPLFASTIAFYPGTATLIRGSFLGCVRSGFRDASKCSWSPPFCGSSMPRRNAPSDLGRVTHTQRALLAREEGRRLILGGSFAFFSCDRKAR